MRSAVRTFTRHLPLLTALSCGPSDAYERHPGWWESATREETRGRLSAASYTRNGLGENGADVYTILSFDGEPVETKGGHFTFVRFCDACVDSVGEALVAEQKHRDPAQRGLFVLQVVDDQLQRTQICSETLGLRDWRGTRYAEPACRWGYYEAAEHRFIDRRVEPSEIPRLTLPTLDTSELARIHDALDEQVSHLERTEQGPDGTRTIPYSPKVEPLLPLGATLVPFVVERLDPNSPDKGARLVALLSHLEAAEATPAVEAYCARLPEDPSARAATMACNRFLQTVGGWP